MTKGDIWDDNRKCVFCGKHGGFSFHSEKRDFFRRHNENKAIFSCPTGGTMHTECWSAAQEYVAIMIRARKFDGDKM